MCLQQLVYCQHYDTQYVNLLKLISYITLERAYQITYLMYVAMALQYKDKVVIVTGAAQGIGRGIAKLFGMYLLLYISELPFYIYYWIH